MLWKLGKRGNTLVAETGVTVFWFDSAVSRRRTSRDSVSISSTTRCSGKTSLAKANGDAPGVDGESFTGIESGGLEEWLNGLGKDLHDKTYQPQPVRRKTIPKPGGGERGLGIPTIRDRVAQTAAKLILEPIWEADLEPNAYGYRPGKSAQDAIQKVNELLRAGYTDIVDADLSKYFDTIPHSELMQCVARRIVDRQMLSVTDGCRRRSRSGTPTGSGG